MSHLLGLMMFLLIIYRPWASFAIVAFAVAVLVLRFDPNRNPLKWKRGYAWAGLLIGLFVLYLIGFFRHVDHPDAYRQLEKKFALLFVPLLWYLSQVKASTARKNIYPWLVAGTSLAGAVMLIDSFSAFIESGIWSSFYYEQLTSPLVISPIYFSYFIALTLFWPVSAQDLPYSISVHSASQALLFMLLLLSASKLFILLVLILWIFQLAQKQIRLRIKWWHTLVMLLSLTLLYPVGSRIQSVVESPLDVVMQDQYTYDTQFSGLTLRLVQLKLGIEILKENKALPLGVGPALAQPALNEAYERHNMYMGNPQLGDKGYAAYNFHNQWMQTLVAVGLPGLVLLLLMLKVFQRPSVREIYTSILILTFSFMFTESSLEREQGIVPFALLMSMIFMPNQAKSANANTD